MGHLDEPRVDDKNVGKVDQRGEPASERVIVDVQEACVNEAYV